MFIFYKYFTFDVKIVKLQWHYMQTEVLNLLKCVKKKKTILTLRTCKKPYSLNAIIKLTELCAAVQN